MKVRIYYNRDGRIVSVVEVKDDKEVPLAGIFSIPDCHDCEIELTDEQAKMPLIALHVGYRLDLTQKQPRLVPLKPARDKRRKAGQRSEG